MQLLSKDTGMDSANVTIYIAFIESIIPTKRNLSSVLYIMA